MLKRLTSTNRGTLSFWKPIMRFVLETSHILRYISLVCAITSAAISIIVLIGWATNHLILAQLGFHYKPQPLISALAFLILSGDLFVYLYKPKHRALSLLAMLCTCLIVFISTILLINDFTGSHFNFEQWLLLSSYNLIYLESNVSPINNMCNILIGFAFILLLTFKADKIYNKSVAAWLAIFASIAAGVILVGYLYNSLLFMQVASGQLTSTSLPAALTSLFLSIGLITAIGEEHLPLRAFIGSSLFAQLMRTMIPLIIILILVQNWIDVTLFQKYSNYALTTAFISVISVILIVLLLSKTTLSISKQIDLAHVEQLRIENELRDALLYNRSLFDVSVDPFVTINLDGKITDVNKATEVATGIPREQQIGSDFSNYFDEPELARIFYKEVFEKGFVKDYSLTMRHVSGDKKNVLYNAILYKDASNQIVGVFAAARDITERKKAEEVAKNYANDLDRSNQELQHFAYVASHDLQEPLRVITSYLQLIERRYKGKLDQDADEFINFAVEGATKLQNMINDLLAYSRVGTRVNQFITIDSSTVVKQALENIKVLIEENHAVITYDNLPTLVADESKLVTLFQNLLSNSIKFHKPSQPPATHITAQNKDREWLFSVRDNGIGIDLKYKDKLFIIFKRLVGQEYPGSGIGLAICKRIVEQHKGHIWVESEYGKGSTFYFTIPK